MAGLDASSVNGFVAKCQKVSNTFPDAKRTGAFKAGMAVKTAWIGIATSTGGLKQTSKPARKKWSVGFDVVGGQNAAALVEFNGRVHLVFRPTKNHIIAAKRLATRSGARARSTKIGVNAAFGGSNRGAFGTMRSAVVKTRSGGTRAFDGKQALTIGGNLRAYAFHPGTKGRPGVLTELDSAAKRIGPQVYQTEYRKALAKAGFGAGQSIIGALK